MKKKKEIVILSIGHPKKVSTWSNVPYFLAKNLERQGCLVHYADIGPAKWLQWPYDKIMGVLTALGLKSEHKFFRSRTNAFITNRGIQRVLAKHQGALPIFMTFSFGARELNRPYVLFSDRTFEHYINYFNHRGPNSTEQKFVNREHDNLASASMIISLFPEMAETLRDYCGDRVKYFGNVVNLPNMAAASNEALEKRWREKRLLFIGKPHYKAGLIRLIKAMNELNANVSSPYHLDVIGTKKSEVIGVNTGDVTFHGYLNKGDDLEFQKYMELLENAFLFVNPNLQWASFSASCEALSRSIPLVIHSYPEFTSTFGTEDNGWWTLPSDEQNDLIALIQRISSDKEVWMQKAKAAREAVEDFTWPNYARKVLAELEKL